MNLAVDADDGVRLAAEVRGPREAPALLLLNSIGCDRRLWDAQLAALHNDFRCIVFDARGHGDSQAPLGEYTLERLARDALRVLDASNAQQAHVCGLSLGGQVAQALALQAPERILTLTLANTASRIGTAEAWEARRRLVLDEGLDAIADMAMRRFFSEPFRADRQDVVEGFRTTLTTGSQEGYAGCCAALRDADLTAEVGRLGARTLVIGGLDDVSTPPDQARALAVAIPGAHLRLLPAAHLSNVEQPAAFTQALRAHLKGS